MLILLLGFAFHITLEFLLATSCVLVFGAILGLIWDYLRKRQFYTTLAQNVEMLDQAYLVLEMLKCPNFYEGEIICDILYQIDKSMQENVNLARRQALDFQEYVEMWIHEIKAPLAALMLKDKNEELERIDGYLEQILYFVRSENAEKDYLIRKVELNDVVKNVALKNMHALLAQKIDLIVENVDCSVMTDAKWLEFILGQIINNSVKYRRKNLHSYLKISARKNRRKIILTIEDNGIGISSADLPRVFDKSFTGTNGRKIGNSTGMGLYIAKQMCGKLGHRIKISSRVNHGTTVSISFSDHDFYKTVERWLTRFKRLFSGRVADARRHGVGALFLVVTPDPLRTSVQISLIIYQE